MGTTGRQPASKLVRRWSTFRALDSAQLGVQDVSNLDPRSTTCSSLRRGGEEEGGAWGAGVASLAQNWGAQDSTEHGRDVPEYLPPAPLILLISFFSCLCPDAHAPASPPIFCNFMICSNFSRSTSVVTAHQARQRQAGIGPSQLCLMWPDIRPAPVNTKTNRRCEATGG